MFDPPRAAFLMRTARFSGRSMQLAMAQYDHGTCLVRTTDTLFQAKIAPASSIFTAHRTQRQMCVLLVLARASEAPATARGLDICSPARAEIDATSAREVFKQTNFILQKKNCLTTTTFLHEQSHSHTGRSKSRKHSCKTHIRKCNQILFKKKSIHNKTCTVKTHKTHCCDPLCDRACSGQMRAA